jgi:acyl-CoA synthetase (AMP-forming)/AMP-acid ligase II
MAQQAQEWISSIPFAKLGASPNHLVELLRYRALSQPNQIGYSFLLDGEDEELSLTYSELDLQARNIGSVLQCIGAEGQRALLLYNPGLEYVAAFFGCLYAGVIPVPIYPPRMHRTLARLRHILNDSTPFIALTTAQIRTRVERIFNQAPDLKAIHWLSTDALTGQAVNSWHEPKITQDTTAFLQYTSGTTSSPRGVMVTHSNLMNNLAMIHQYFQLNSEGQGVSWLPPYHDMGLIGGVLEPLYAGFPVTLMSPTAFLQSPLRWLKAISKTKATTSGGPDYAYELCVQKISEDELKDLDLSSWNLAINGSEPVHYRTLELFSKKFKKAGFRKEAFFTCYGLAESTLLVTGTEKGEFPKAMAVSKKALLKNQIVPTLDALDTHIVVNCGSVKSDQTIAVVNPSTAFRCSPNEIGEIWLRGPCVTQGYWRKPDVTKLTFDAHLADSGEGPFLRTGDLGFIKDGKLYYMGRLRDRIHIDGHDYYPHHIEETVRDSHFSIRPGCTAAFSIHLNSKDEVVVLVEADMKQFFKGPKESRSFEEMNPSLSLDIEDISKAVRRAVQKEHGLDVYSVVLIRNGAIPRTSSGKIQRHACRLMYLSGSMDILGVWIKEGERGVSHFFSNNAEEAM